MCDLHSGKAYTTPSHEHVYPPHRYTPLTRPLLALRSSPIRATRGFGTRAAPLTLGERFPLLAFARSLSPSPLGGKMQRLEGQRITQAQAGWSLSGNWLECTAPTLGVCQTQSSWFNRLFCQGCSAERSRSDYKIPAGCTLSALSLSSPSQ